MTVEDYLKKCTAGQHLEFYRIKQIVNEIVVDSEQTISYGMPTFKYKNKYLLAFGVFKDHISIFPGSGPIEALKKELLGYKISKGTIQYSVEKPLKKRLLRTVILFCQDRIDNPEKIL